MSVSEMKSKSMGLVPSRPYWICWEHEESKFTIKHYPGDDTAVIRLGIAQMRELRDTIRDLISDYEEVFNG